MHDFTNKTNGLFKANPETTRYFLTSDGQVFELECHANAHAETRKDKTVTEVFRPDMTAAQIEQFKAAEALDAKTDLEKIYRKVFPELAKSIDANAKKYGQCAL